MATPRAFRRWLHRLGALACVALLAGVLAERAPHTVHHLFDHEEQGQAECELALAEDRTHVVEAAEARLAPPAARPLAERGGRRQRTVARAVAPSDARAPPPSDS